ncbi:MAG: hypothetical protein R1F52_06500 [Candidatus Nitrosoabyssus spongiisocia]|nr:MAG: hypothetical protein R1F52_06500 [Nitrosopumilaceae archaeon AB1(1)]
MIKTKEDMLNFIKISINQNVQIHEVIEKYLINYAMPNKLYFDIIIMLAKNRNSFVILQNLNKLHKQNAKIATWLCQELIKTSDLDIAYVLGYLYNGIYEKNLDDFFDKVDGKLTDIEKIGFLCTVEIFFSSNQNIPKTIHKFIISLSESESNQLKNFAVRCLVRIGLSDYDIKTHLLRIVKTCNDTIKSEMIVYLTSMNKNEKKFTVKLLKELSDTNNKKLKKEIDQKFTELISHNAIEYLKIIKKWSECKDFGNNYHEYRTIDLLGDGDLNTIHSFMIMWIQCENNYRKTPCLSNVISRIYINKIDDSH